MADQSDKIKDILNKLKEISPELTEEFEKARTEGDKVSEMSKELTLKAKELQEPRLVILALATALGTTIGAGIDTPDHVANCVLDLIPVIKGIGESYAKFLQDKDTRAEKKPKFDMAIQMPGVGIA